MRATVAEGLAVDFDDARGAIAASIARTSPIRCLAVSGSPRPKRPAAIASSRSRKKNVSGSALEMLLDSVA